MPSGFEVGKKYRKITPMKTGMVVECTYATDTSRLGCCAPAVAVLKFSGGAEFSVSRDEWDQYEEVIEPRREFFNTYMGGASRSYYIGPYFNRVLADEADLKIPNRKYPRYGVLELIHHSDNGTREGGSYKVESVFHMVKK